VPGSNGTLNSDGSDCSDNTAAGIFRSKDGGSTFATADFVPTPGGDVITYIATTPTDSNLVWVGLCTPVPNNCTPGSVAVSTDFQSANPTFTKKAIPGAPGSNPISIAIDPNNTDHVVVVFPGFNNIALPTRTKHVFATTDGGTTWADIGGTAGDATRWCPTCR
jgi:hypothetical protein